MGTEKYCFSTVTFRTKKFGAANCTHGEVFCCIGNPHAYRLIYIHTKKPRGRGGINQKSVKMSLSERAASNCTPGNSVGVFLFLIYYGKANVPEAILKQFFHL